MKNHDYWEHRMLLLESRTYRDAKRQKEAVAHAFRDAKLGIYQEIEIWTYRIAENDEVLFYETQKRLDGRELEDLQWRVAEYIDYAQKNKLDPKWIRRLEHTSRRVDVSRWEAICIHLAQYLMVAYGKEREITRDLLATVAKERYDAALYEVMSDADHYSVNAYATDAAIHTAWTVDGKIFSDRIRLACAAKRLIITESSAAATRAQMEAFRDLDIDEVEIIATLDGKTCERCGSKDMQRYPISTARIGYELPPFHPNCRCTFAPYVEGYEPTERMARDPDSGKSEYVPHMSYAEWRNRYLQPRQDVIHSDRSSDIISRGSSKGKPSAILHVGDGLNHRQQRILEALPNTDDRVTVRKKGVSMKDLAALTAYTGDEFAMFTKGGERLIMRGETTRVNVGVEEAERLAADGYRFSGHTHPTVDPLDLMSSKGDRAVLRIWNEDQCYIQPG